MLKGRLPARAAATTGASPHPRDHSNTPCGGRNCNYALRWACGNGHETVVHALLALPPERGVDPGANRHCAICWVSANGHVAVVHALLEHTPGTATIVCLNAARHNRRWCVMALLLEQDLDLSHEQWLEVQLSCVMGGQATGTLLARVSYLQRRDSFLAHQLLWRRR